MNTEARKTFLIVTTGRLPEADFLAHALIDRGHTASILSLRHRGIGDKLRVFSRLARRRGVMYLADFLLGRVARRLVLREQVDPYPEVTAKAAAGRGADVPCLVCNDLHAFDVLDHVRRLAPDYILLAGAPVVRPELFGLAKHGALNRHLGIAPAYRGSDCLLWALAGDEPDAVGFTIHFVSPKVDAGDIVMRQRVPPRPGLSLGAYLALVQRTASDAFLAVIGELLRRGHVPTQVQPGPGRHFPPVTMSGLLRAARNYARATAVDVAFAEAEAQPADRFR